MDTFLSQEKLQEVFDQVIRNVTEREAGILLYQENAPPNGELYTVYAAFEGGFNSSLSLCADASMFTRLTQHMMREKEITPQDVEDFTKEYFNVVCGHIAAELFRTTRVASRFGVPAFYYGRYEPEGRREQFALRYSSDQNECAQLIHHINC